jgi:hypothetical protein
LFAPLPVLIAHITA